MFFLFIRQLFRFSISHFPLILKSWIVFKCGIQVIEMISSLFIFSIGIELHVGDKQIHTHTFFLYVWCSMITSFIWGSIEMVRTYVYVLSCVYSVAQAIRLIGIKESRQKKKVISFSVFNSFFSLFWCTSVYPFLISCGFFQHVFFFISGFIHIFLLFFLLYFLSTFIRKWMNWKCDFYHGNQATLVTHRSINSLSQKNIG